MIVLGALSFCGPCASPRLVSEPFKRCDSDPRSPLPLPLSHERRHQRPRRRRCVSNQSLRPRLLLSLTARFPSSFSSRSSFATQACRRPTSRTSRRRADTPPRPPSPSSAGPSSSALARVLRLPPPPFLETALDALPACTLFLQPHRHQNGVHPRRPVLPSLGDRIRRQPDLRRPGLSRLRKGLRRALSVPPPPPRPSTLSATN